MDEMIRDLAREDLPPEPPRELMWRAISAERARRRAAAAGPRFSLPFWLRWTPAFAAALALGIALGRWSGSGPAGPPQPVAATAEAEAPSTVWTLAARRHLTSAEALLVAFPQDAAAGRTQDVAHWAGDLLIDTRLLAESPAGEDPEIGRLLDDLELVLAQIAALRGDARTGDVLLVEDGLNQTDMLGRLRVATGNGVASGL